MKRFIATFKLLSLIPALLLASTATAEVYQWRDAAGRLHFGDQPPAHVDYQRFEPSGGIADDPAPAPEREASPQLVEDSEGTDECAEARETLERYRNADRLVETTDDGEERALSEAEREEAIALQQTLVDRACED